jgi:hypothetical protein
MAASVRAQSAALPAEAFVREPVDRDRQKPRTGCSSWTSHRRIDLYKFLLAHTIQHFYSNPRSAGQFVTRIS